MTDPEWSAQQRAITRDRGRLRMQLTTLRVPQERWRVRLALKALRCELRDHRLAVLAESVRP